MCLDRPISWHLRLHLRLRRIVTGGKMEVMDIFAEKVKASSSHHRKVVSHHEESHQNLVEVKVKIRSPISEHAVQLELGGGNPRLFEI